MKELERRFLEKIKEAKFNIFEIKGFQERPELALLAGMAIGYRMGLDDFEKK